MSPEDLTPLRSLQRSLPQARSAHEGEELRLQIARYCADNLDETLRNGPDFVSSQLEIFGTRADLEGGDLRRLARLAFDDHLREHHHALWRFARSLLLRVRAELAPAPDPLRDLSIRCHVTGDGPDPVFFDHPLAALRWVASVEARGTSGGCLTVHFPEAPDGAGP